MAQKDWEEVRKIIDSQSSGFFEKFLRSKQIFFPNESMLNPFEASSSNFSSLELRKSKPGQWIPVYYIKDIPEFFQKNGVVPVRAGSAEFFFYRGRVFFDLESVDFKKVDTAKISPIESFVPVTLKAKFQRNENAYLNKAIAMGYINHFVDGVELTIFEREIEIKTRKRLLYGQFGKIKISNPLQFKTSKGNKPLNPGFQFEIDLVLENKNEIIVFEAKTGSKPFNNFSLLQLYYPLIYLRSIIKEPKPIRTVFIDITAIDDQESYRLLEVHFDDDNFDRVEVIFAREY